jgi:putative ABC transport system permease protein
MDNLWQDLRYGLRMLYHRPLFTIVAVLALALGIGANSAVFTVINGVLLRPLPYEKSDQLVWVWDSQPQIDTAPASLPDYLDWRQQSRSFAEIAAFTFSSYTLVGGEQPEVINGANATANIFAMLGFKAEIGRTFLPEENRLNSDVAVLTYGGWERRFGRDPNIIGRQITLNGVIYNIIGVMPASFQFASKVEVWTPLPLDKNNTDRGPHYLSVMARLKDGVTIAEAQAEMNVITAQIQQAHPDKNVGHGAKLKSFYQYVVSDIRPALLMLLVAVALVLLMSPICCWHAPPPERRRLPSVSRLAQAV